MYFVVQTLVIAAIIGALAWIEPWIGVLALGGLIAAVAWAKHGGGPDE